MLKLVSQKLLLTTLWKRLATKWTIERNHLPAAAALHRIAVHQARKRVVIHQVNQTLENQTRTSLYLQMTILMPLFLDLKTFGWSNFMHHGAVTAKLLSLNGTQRLLSSRVKWDSQKLMLQLKKDWARDSKCKVTQLSSTLIMVYLRVKQLPRSTKVLERPDPSLASVMICLRKLMSSQRSWNSLVRKYMIKIVKDRLFAWFHFCQISMILMLRSAIITLTCWRRLPRVTERIHSFSSGYQLVINLTWKETWTLATDSQL